MAYTTIDDGSAHFQAVIYTGGGNSSSVTFGGNSDLQPDFLWIKRRDSADNSKVFDTSRGVGSGNEPYLTTVSNEEEQSYNYLASMDSDGFTHNTTDSSTGASGNTYVAWGWKANGGTTASNSNGSLASTVQANTTSGFSIVTYTGTGSAATIGHGLGAIPHLIIVKNRSASQNWRVFHKDAFTGGGYGQYQSGLRLNDTNAADHGANSYWNNNSFTTSTFSLGTSAEVNVSSQNFVAYCLVEKQGYSKFGSYTGNGNVNNAFVYLGFKPAFLIIKRSDNTSSWHMWDNKREDYNGNPNDTHLKADNIGAEGDTTDYSIDFLSNGFKVRNASELDGTSGGIYIFMAFAESPFVSSEGVPCTAR